MKSPKPEARVTNETRGRSSGTGFRTARSVLECASPLALWLRTRCSAVLRSGRGLPQSKTWRTLLTLVLLRALDLQLATALAQSYAIPWHTMDGGGGTSTGGVYAVSGTIGQPDAGGPMTNGQFSLTGGFWALPQVVQTPGAPTLFITHAAPGWATLWWTPATGTNWVLQERLSLTSGAWSNSPSGPTNPVTVPATLPGRFYRLFKP